MDSEHENWVLANLLIAPVTAIWWSSTILDF